MPKPLLEMKMERIKPCSPQTVAALPGGEALICWRTIKRQRRRHLQTHLVSKVSNQGKKVQEIYNCTGCYITGLLILGEYIFIIHDNGTVLQLSLENWKLLIIYQINNTGGRILHTGSLASDPSMIPDHYQLFLADNKLYQVFTYRLSTGKKVIRDRWPNVGPPFYGYPRTVSYGFYITLFSLLYLHVMVEILAIRL